MKTRYSVGDIRNAYRESEDVDFYRYSIARLFFRPLSFYGAWVFLRLGITANQTTLLSWVLVLVGCFLYLFLPPTNTWSPLILILAWAVLDYMDGAMARVTETRSKYGHFIDVLGAYFMLAFLPICLGVGLFRYPEHSIERILNLLGSSVQIDPVVLLITGAFASLNNILLRLVVSRMQLTFGIDPRQESDKKGRIGTLLAWIEALSSPRGFFFPLLIAATAFQFVEWFVVLYFLFYTLALIAYITYYAYEYRKH